MSELELFQKSSELNTSQLTPLVDPTEDEEKGEGARTKCTSWIRKNWTRVVEVNVFILLLFLLWGVYAAVPTVFYVLKPVLQVYNMSGERAEVSATGQPILCAKEFYLHNGTSCRPLCHIWVSGNVTEDLVKDIFTILVSVICLLSCAVLGFIAFTIQREEMLKFPRLYLVYASFTTAVVALFVLIGFVDRRHLFCYSDDLIDTFKHETAFCTISGIVYVYGVVQLNIWAMFHAIGLCWGIVFPFHYRTFKMAGRIKYIHIATVLFGLFFPTIPALLYLMHGYAALFTPTRVCTGRSLRVTYFAFLLPSSIILATTTFALVVVFWTILKEMLLKKLTKTTRKRFVQVGKAEARVLFVVCYYVLLGIIGIVTLTYFEATNPSNLVAIKDYFNCQLPGYHPNERNHCGTRPSVRLLPFNVLSAVGIVQLAFIPVVILVFTVSCTKSNCDKWKKKLHQNKKN